MLPLFSHHTGGDVDAAAIRREFVEMALFIIGPSSYISPLRLVIVANFKDFAAVALVVGYLWCSLSGVS